MKEIIKEITITIVFILLMVGMFELIILATQHEGMLHNVDLIFNTVKNDEILENTVDFYEPGKSIPIKDLYIQSMNNLRNIHLRNTAIALATGLLAGMLFQRITKKDEKKTKKTGGTKQKMKTNNKLLIANIILIIILAIGIIATINLYKENLRERNQWEQEKRCVYWADTAYNTSYGNLSERTNYELTPGNNTVTLQLSDLPRVEFQPECKQWITYQQEKIVREGLGLQ